MIVFDSLRKGTSDLEAQADLKEREVKRQFKYAAQLESRASVLSVDAARLAEHAKARRQEIENALHAKLDEIKDPEMRELMRKLFKRWPTGSHPDGLKPF